VSLRPDEQQVLGQIEQTLQVCNPKLAGMLSIFTQLTAHERMPQQEGLLTVPTAQNTARRTATARPAGMSLQGTASTRNCSNFNVGEIVFFASALTIVILALIWALV
jgi:hypothetical protein